MKQEKDLDVTVLEKENLTLYFQEPVFIIFNLCMCVCVFVCVWWWGLADSKTQ